MRMRSTTTRAIERFADLHAEAVVEAITSRSASVRRSSATERSIASLALGVADRASSFEGELIYLGGKLRRRIVDEIGFASDRLSSIDVMDEMLKSLRNELMKPQGDESFWTELRLIYLKLIMREIIETVQNAAWVGERCGEIRAQIDTYARIIDSTWDPQRPPSDHVSEQLVAT